MIDNNELTEEEKFQLRKLILEKQKAKLEAQIEEMQLQARGFKNGKKTIEQLTQYFKD